MTVAETDPYPPPSVPVSRHPNLDRILLPRSRFNRQSAYPPPLLSATLSIWLRPYHQAPSSDGASFFACHSGALLAGEWTECRCVGRMAGIPTLPLLTIRSKSIFTPVAATCSVSSSLGPCCRHPVSSRILLPRLGTTGRAHLLLPCSLPHFRFGFGPIIRLHLRMEPLFFAHSFAACMAALPNRRLSCRV